MKRKKFTFLIICFLAVCSFFTLFNSGISVVRAEESVYYLGGMPAGFSIYSFGAPVAGICDVITEDGVMSPSKDCDIIAGDIILSIDGKEVSSAQDIENEITGKKNCIIVVERQGEKIIKNISPVKDVNGKYKLGIFIRDCINGIGTITFIKDGRFASLGHPVVDENGKIMNIRGGKIFACSITGTIKGERGMAGELKGVFLKTVSLGTIDKNTNNGVYGEIHHDDSFTNLSKIEIGDAKIGNASIFTTIKGQEPEEYSIQIVKVDSLLRDTKNYVIKITDERLLAETGGIVQGMSGSPIVQEGKLVGAVTHVFINDPTRGYGIDIDNMINN